jgi:2-desacetyl-2-hydroxyethyl bacteriochlorophyllide A dehydrogenase
LYDFGGPVRLDEVPEPSISEDDVLVRVKASSLGLGERLLMEGLPAHIIAPSAFEFPHIPGFKGAGVVERVGANVSLVAPGDRVVINGFVNCRRCSECYKGRDNMCNNLYRLGKDSGHSGCMAEMTRAPWWTIYKLPDTVSFSQANLFPDVALIIRALDRAALRPGFTAAIIGCGLVGSVAIQVVRAYGARWLICVDKRDNALQLARKLGADETVNAADTDPVEVIRDLTQRRGVDLAIELVGQSETMEQTVHSTAKRGTALLLGVLEPTIKLHFEHWYEDILRKDVTILISWGWIQHDFYRAIGLAEAGLIDISAHDFEEYDFAAFEDAARRVSDASHTNHVSITLTK